MAEELVETPEPAEDIRSMLDAAVAESEKLTEEKPEKPEKLETEGAREDGRARDASGKFVAKPAETETPLTPETPTEPPEAKEVKSAVEPPQNWAETDKQKFKSAPAELQGWLLDRHKAMEADYTKKTQEIAEFRKEWEPVHQTFAPHREQMKAAGWTPPKLIQAWASVEQRFMSGDGLNAMRDIAKAYKIDLAQLATQQPTPQTGQVPAPVDPAVLAALTPVQQQVQQLMQAENQRQAQAAQAAKDEEQRQLQAATSKVTAFAEAKDAKGTALHPHYAEVEADMAIRAQALMSAGKPVDLQEIYDYAVWANPSTREKVLTAQKQSEDLKRTEEARAKAAQAKKAGSSVTGAPTGQTPKETPRNRSLRDELRAAADAEIDAA